MQTTIASTDTYSYHLLMAFPLILALLGVLLVV